MYALYYIYTCLFHTPSFLSNSHPFCYKGMAPKILSFVKRSKNVDEVLKVDNEVMEVPHAGTPMN